MSDEAGEGRAADGAVAGLRENRLNEQGKRAAFMRHRNKIQ